MTGVDIEACVREGYLPIELAPARNQLVLAPLAEASFDEPVYDQTVLSRTHPFVVPAPVPLDKFLEGVRGMHSAAPIHVIVHTARCGSTMLANLLALRAQVMVMKEPYFLNVALGAAGTIARDAAALLLRYSAHVAASRDRQLVVKATSITSARLLSDVLPVSQGRWLLLWRDPAEVVASLRDSPPGWGGEQLASMLRLEKVAEGGIAREFAPVWRAIAAAFIESSARFERLAALEYAELVADPLETLLAVEGWCGLAGGVAAPVGFDDAVRRYSKSTNGEVFEPDGVHFRPPLSEADQRCVEDTTGALVGRLRALSFRAHSKSRIDGSASGRARRSNS